MQSNPYLRAMAPAHIAPRPRELFFALLSAAVAAHTAFLVVLTWLRPGLDFGAVVSLMFLPLLFFLLGFVPVIALVALVRIALITLSGGRLLRSLWLVALLALAGVAIAALLAWAAAGWLRDEQIVSSVIFGAAVGGVIAGMKIAGKEEPQP